MGRGARTNKHVYCSRREGPDPAGAAEPPGAGCGAARAGGARSPGEAVGPAPLPSLPDTSPRAGLGKKQRPFLTRRLLAGHGRGHRRQWARGGGGEGRGFPGLGKGPLGPNPPHQGNSVAKQIVPGGFRGEWAGSVPHLSPLLLAFGAEARHKPEARGSRRSWAGEGGESVPVPHGSAPSVARVKSGRARAGSPPAEGLRERVPQTREERKGERESPGPSLPLLPSW